MTAELSAARDPRPAHRLDDDAARADPLTAFVGDALAVASATDPLLAKLLASIVGGDGGAEGRAPEWRGDRKAGLELCLRLLSYLRRDVCDRRLDVSLGYIAGELGSGEAPQRSLSAH